MSHPAELILLFHLLQREVDLRHVLQNLPDTPWHLEFLKESFLEAFQFHLYPSNYNPLDYPQQLHHESHRDGHGQ